MASNTQWIQKTSKRTKNASQSKAKNKGKTFVETMPTIETAPPVKESATIYDAFLPDKKTENNSDRNGDVKTKASGKTSKPTQPSKKKNQDKKSAKMSLAEACQLIEVSEFESLLSTVKERFPESPAVWLKDLASLLNLKLDRVQNAESAFTDKDSGLPSSFLTNKVKSLILKVIRQSSMGILEIFLGHCLQAVSTDSNKGISVHGERIMLQLLLTIKPEVVINNSQKYLQSIQTCQNRPDSALAMLKSLGQAGNSDLNNALKVWIDLMYPFINVKHLSAFVVQYLENALRLHEDAISSGTGSLTFRDFFPLLDLTHAQHPSLPSNLQKRMQNMYPTLKSLAFSSNSLHLFFPSFLVRCSMSSNRDLRSACLQCLIECLSKDTESYSKWRQMYTKHLVQSGVLLSHIVENWQEVSQKLDVSKLCNTVTTFCVTNQQLAEKTEGRDVCAATCQEILSKNRRSSLPWLWLLVLVLGLSALVIGSDCYVHAGFHKSETRRFLEKYQILHFLSQIMSRAQLYFSKVTQWLGEHLPVYYSRACDLLSPYLQLFWEKLYEFSVYVITLCQPLIQWIHTNGPRVFDWIQKQLPWLLDSLSHIVGIVVDVVFTYGLLAWQHTVYWLSIAGEWLLTNVFIDSWSIPNLISTVSALLAQMSAYVQQLGMWCSSILNGQASSS